MNATLLNRGGRTFKVDRGRSGEVAGWIVFERDLEAGVTWSPVSGAFPLKRDAYAHVDSLT